MNIDSAAEFPQSAEGNREIVVRTWDDGTNVSSIKDREKPKSVWQTTNSLRSLGESNLIETHFTLPEMPKIGSILEFDGRHFQVVPPQRAYLSEQFGKNSAFVKPLSQEEYLRLTEKKSP